MVTLKQLRPLILAVSALVAVVAGAHTIGAIDKLLEVVPPTMWLVIALGCHAGVSIAILLSWWSVALTDRPSGGAPSRWRHWLSQDPLPWSDMALVLGGLAVATLYFVVSIAGVAWYILTSTNGG